MMFSPRKGAIYFLFVFLVASQCRGDRGYPPAPNCASHECPSYTVVHSEKEFEIRSYKNAAWVSGPKIFSRSYKAAADEGFRILFSYYQGNNKQRVKINMTAPVLVDFQNSTYTVYFYVPQKYQSGTPLPQPLTSDVTQVTLPKHKYASVRRFDGFITNIRLLTAIDALKQSLRGTPYQRVGPIDEFTVAGYNSPFEPTDRVNEVMFFFD